MKNLKHQKTKIWMLIVILLMQILLPVSSIIMENALTKISMAADNVNTSTDKVHFLVLGDSDSILIESNGRYGLIDTSNPSKEDWNVVSDGCGDYRSSTYNGKKVATYLNDLGVKELDFIVGTHSHSDHIGGILDICNAREYLESATGEPVDFITENTTYIYKKYNLDSDVTVRWNNEGYYNWALNAVENDGAKLLEVQDHTDVNLKQISQDAKFVNNEENTNDYIEFTFENYNIKIFNLYTVSTREENVNSLVILITKGNKRMLFMADMNVWEETEQKIAKYIGKVDLIKIGHHGHDKSTSIDLLTETNPKIAIVTTSGWVDNLDTVSSFLKENSGEMYLTSNAKKAIVAQIGTSDIVLKTYDENSELNIAPTESETSATGWIYSYINYTDKTWLYVDTETKSLVKGWKEIIYNGVNYWFYFAEENNDEFCIGEMVKGLQKVVYNNKECWFYFSETATDDYCSGAMVTGWKKLEYGDKSYWFYFSKTTTDDLSIGAMVTGWKQITYNGESCLFYFTETSNENYCEGAMVTGWQVIDGIGYYFDENGVMQEKDESAPSINSVSISTTDWTKESVIVTVNAEDGEVGLDKEAYSFDGGLTWQADNTKAYTNNIDNIVIKVRDAGGNIAEYDSISITNILKLESIEITKEPSQKTYIEGQNFDKAGMIVTAIYNSGDTEDITGYTITDGENLPAGKASVTISYTEKGITKEIIQEITVLEKLKISFEEYVGVEVDNKNYIRNIKVNTAIEEIKENIVTNGEIKIYKGETEIADTKEKIATGMTIRINLRDENKEYIITVNGDVTGDGESNIRDILAINKHRLNKVTLTGEYSKAGDVTGDGNVDIRDILQINKYRLGKIENL